MAPVVPPDVRVTAIVAAGNAHVATPSWVKVNFTGTTPRLHQGEHREARPSLPSLRRVALKRYAINSLFFIAYRRRRTVSKPFGIFSNSRSKSDKTLSLAMRLF